MDVIDLKIDISGHLPCRKLPWRWGWWRSAWLRCFRFAFGIKAQRDNRDDTVIRYEGEYWAEALLGEGLNLADLSEWRWFRRMTVIQQVL